MRWLLVIALCSSGCADDELAPPAAAAPRVEVTFAREKPRPKPKGKRGKPDKRPSKDGTVVVRITDTDGAVIPARLTFVGAKFTTDDVGISQPGGVLAHDRAFVSGEATLTIPVGTYTVWISHGPEWDAASRTLVVSAGETATLEATLAHVVELPGWISGDFHVHADRSWDSKVRMGDRALQFLADGVDLIVSTDHDTVADYAPVVAALGIADRLATLCGDELTMREWGHFGAFPLSPWRPAVSNTLPPLAAFAELRARGDVIIDVHHPRLLRGRMGYFHLGQLDPQTMSGARPGFSLDFDALEVLNGYQAPDRESVDAVLGDWFAFLRRGKHVTGTGNSDSHHLTFNLGGFPRNYVYSDDKHGIVRALKAGQSFFTTGPIIEVIAPGGVGLGGTATAVDQHVDLDVTVRAPAWIDVDRVSVYVDGVPLVHRAATGEAPVRFAGAIRVPVGRDGFIIVRVDGDRPMAPLVGDLAAFKVYPLAITNPIWVDADGDGTVTPLIQ